MDFFVSVDDPAEGLPTLQSHVQALLKYTSCSQAHISITTAGKVHITVAGGVAAVQTRNSNATVPALPAGIRWQLAVEMVDAEGIEMLTQLPVLCLTCPSCHTTQLCSTPDAALLHMSSHSSHCPAWADTLSDHEHQQQLQQRLRDLQQQQPNQQQLEDVDSLLPIQRAAALLCVEAAHLILRSPELLKGKPRQWLEQLALSILFHRGVWSLTSFLRPRETSFAQRQQQQEGQQQQEWQQQQQQDVHLLWLLVGAPPYCQSSGTVPEQMKHYCTEVSCIVALLHRLQLLQHWQTERHKAAKPPSQQQVLAAMQQLLLQFSGGRHTSTPGPAAAGTSSGSNQQHQPVVISEQYVRAWLALRGLTLQHIVNAVTEDTGIDTQLDFCVICGKDFECPPGPELVRCTSCCHSYHARCALDEAGVSYTAAADNAARHHGKCLGCQQFPLDRDSVPGLAPGSSTAAAAGPARKKAGSTKKNKKAAGVSPKPNTAAAAAGGTGDQRRKAGERKRRSSSRSMSPAPPPAAAVADTGAKRRASGGQSKSPAPLSPPAAAVRGRDRSKSPVPLSSAASPGVRGRSSSRSLSPEPPPPPPTAPPAPRQLARRPDNHKNIPKHAAGTDTADAAQGTHKGKDASPRAAAAAVAVVARSTPVTLPGVLVSRPLAGAAKGTGRHVSRSPSPPHAAAAARHGKVHAPGDAHTAQTQPARQQHELENAEGGAVSAAAADSNGREVSKSVHATQPGGQATQQPQQQQRWPCRPREAQGLSDAAAAAAAKQHYRHSRRTARQLGLTAETLRDCKGLLRHGLLPAGMLLDFNVDQRQNAPVGGRFRVVSAAAAAGAGAARPGVGVPEAQEQQQQQQQQLVLQCTACNKVCSALSAAEKHVLRHRSKTAKDCMRLVGTEMSIGDFLQWVVSAVNGDSSTGSEGDEDEQQQQQERQQQQQQEGNRGSRGEEDTQGDDLQERRWQQQQGDQASDSSREGNEDQQRQRQQGYTRGSAGLTEGAAAAAKSDELRMPRAAHYASASPLQTGNRSTAGGADRVAPAAAAEPGKFRMPRAAHASQQQRGSSSAGTSAAAAAAKPSGFRMPRAAHLTRPVAGQPAAVQQQQQQHGNLPCRPTQPHQQSIAAAAATARQHWRYSRHRAWQLGLNAETLRDCRGLLQHGLLPVGMLLDLHVGQSQKAPVGACFTVVAAAAGGGGPGTQQQQQLALRCAACKQVCWSWSAAEKHALGRSNNTMKDCMRLAGTGTSIGDYLRWVVDGLDDDEFDGDEEEQQQAGRQQQQQQHSPLQPASSLQSVDLAAADALQLLARGLVSPSAATSPTAAAAAVGRKRPAAAAAAMAPEGAVGGDAQLNITAGLAAEAVGAGGEIDASAAAAAASTPTVSHSEDNADADMHDVRMTAADAPPLAAAAAARETPAAAAAAAHCSSHHTAAAADGGGSTDVQMAEAEQWALPSSRDPRLRHKAQNNQQQQSAAAPAAAAAAGGVAAMLASAAGADNSADEVGAVGAAGARKRSQPGGTPDDRAAAAAAATAAVSSEAAVDLIDDEQPDIKRQHTERAQPQHQHQQQPLLTQQQQQQHKAASLRWRMLRVDAAVRKQQGLQDLCASKSHSDKELLQQLLDLWQPVPAAVAAAAAVGDEAGSSAAAAASASAIVFGSSSNLSWSWTAVKLDGIPRLVLDLLKVSNRHSSSSSTANQVARDVSTIVKGCLIAVRAAYRTVRNGNTEQDSSSSITAAAPAAGGQGGGLCGVPQHRTADEQQQQHKFAEQRAVAKAMLLLSLTAFANSAAPSSNSSDDNRLNSCCFRMAASAMHASVLVLTGGGSSSSSAHQQQLQQCVVLCHDLQQLMQQQQQHAVLDMRLFEELRVLVRHALVKLPQQQQQQGCRPSSSSSSSGGSSGMCLRVGLDSILQLLQLVKGAPAALQAMLLTAVLESCSTSSNSEPGAASAATPADAQRACELCLRAVFKVLYKAAQLKCHLPTQQQQQHVVGHTQQQQLLVSQIRQQQAYQVRRYAVQALVPKIAAALAAAKACISRYSIGAGSSNGLDPVLLLQPLPDLFGPLLAAMHSALKSLLLPDQQLSQVVGSAGSLDLEPDQITPQMHIGAPIVPEARGIAVRAVQLFEKCTAAAAAAEVPAVGSGAAEAEDGQQQQQQQQLPQPHCSVEQVLECKSAAADCSCLCHCLIDDCWLFVEACKETTPAAK